MDDYIIYMFKLYQATQARMNDGLVQTLNTRIAFLTKIVIIQVVILLASLGVWLWGKALQQESSGDVWLSVRLSEGNDENEQNSLADNKEAAAGG